MPWSISVCKRRASVCAFFSGQAFGLPMVTRKVLPFSRPWKMYALAPVRVTRHPRPPVFASQWMVCALPGSHRNPETVPSVNVTFAIAGNPFVAM